MPFRFDREASVHRLEKLEDDVRARELEIGKLRRAALARPDARWRHATIALGVLAVVLTVLTMALVLRPIAEAAARAPELAFWEPAQEGPFFVDVDGDGDEEILGVVRAEEGRGWLALVDPIAGQTRWRAPLAPERRHFALQGRAVVLAEGRSLTVRRLSDGEVVRWLELPEPVLEVCARRDRTGPVWLRGRTEHRLLHPDGRLEPSLRPAFCDPQQVTSPPRIQGVAAEAALFDGHHFVTLGRDAQGMALAAFALGDRRIRWQKSVSAGSLEAGRDLLLHEERLFVAHGAIVAAYAVASGEPLWQVDLGAATARRLAGGFGRLAVVFDGRLVVLDARDGQTLATIGR